MRFTRSFHWYSPLGLFWEADCCSITVSCMNPGPMQVQVPHKDKERRTGGRAIDVKSILGLSFSMLSREQYQLEIYGPD
ncbi:hypothetical protein BGX30_008953 [Mortierella sp. GBA39]|nr:hypothetical protein BGX30_008953 [Mortierella sp. GBA39]